MSRFNSGTAHRFLGGTPNASEHAAHLTSDVCTGMEIVAEGAVQKWNELIGPENSVTAKLNASRSLRAAYGTNAV